MIHTIEITSRVRTKIPVALMREACVAALRGEGVKSAEISVLVVGDAAMRGYNRKLLGHDYTTDVISILLGATPQAALMGQLILCLPEARRQAKLHDIPVGEELARYVVHGTLHLLGYDDTREKERAKMWAMQEKIVWRVVTSRYSRDE